MSLRVKLATVDAAEADCAVRRAAVTASWRGFKREAGLAATPRRVIVAGLATGFLAGLPRLGGANGGSLLGGKLLGVALDTVIASISGAIGAGAAAANTTTPGQDDR